MARLVECQFAIVPWGTKARYRRAKVGLIRKGSQVYIAVFTQTTQHKFSIIPGSLQLMPAAIRLMDVQSDLFIRHVNDEQRYADMLRGIKVLLRREELRRSGKGEKLDRFIGDLPTFSSLKQSDITVAAQSARIGLGDASQNRDQVGGEINNGQLVPHPAGLNERELAYYNELKKQDKQRLANEQLKSIKSVGLIELPNQLWLAKSLDELQLIDCNISELPKQLEQLAPTLRSLDLSRNKIRTLPRTFCCKMNRLIYLNLSSNMIETLPLEIKFLERLYEFNIANNCLKMLPTTLSDISSLKVLKVSNNKLCQLPAFRRGDIRLATLDISHNPLDGAQRHCSTSKVHSSYDDHHDPYFLSFMSSPVITMQQSSSPSSQLKKNNVPSLFEISILNVVRSDDLFKLASEVPLPGSIISTIQRDIFKCFGCSKMNVLPAYNSTDTLDYVDQIDNLVSSGNYSPAMTFMKLLCRSCFGFSAS